MKRLRTTYPTWARPTCANQSSALVIVLFMVVILSTTLVAFMLVSSMDRASSQSYSQGVSAEQVGQEGLAQVVTDLQQEILTNSTAVSASGYTIYTPKFATNAQPELSLAGNTAASAPNLVLGLVPNLVKISSHAQAPFAQGAIEATSVNTTANASLNGRFISAARWNKPAMITNAWPSGSLQTPDWIDVTRRGVAPQSLTVAQARDSSLANTNYVVGRYAYAVYDEGGMLDVNVAGYPSTSTPSDLTATLIGRKGNLSLADLTQIPNGSTQITTAQADALIKWRNGYSLSTSYTNYITTIGATNGFLYVQGNGTSADNTFLSRQDLISYAAANNLTNALPYLATFTREKNRPSWYPTQDASSMTDASGTIAGNNGTGNVYAYATNRNSTSAINRDIQNVRVVNPFPRADGSTAVAGEPLVKRRFPLSRLALLSLSSAPTSGQAALIKQYFGLVLDANGTTWDYENPGGASAASTILTLGQVAALPAAQAREPDFFELLKAAILSGSLGLSPGAPASTSGGAAGTATDDTAVGTAPNLTTMSSNADAQILQIGANIIDQYRAGNYPIDIYAAIFTTTTAGLSYDTYNHFHGIKDLPYLQRMACIYSYDPVGAESPTTTGINGWYVPEISNPHQYSTISSGPTRFRIQAFGGRSFLTETEHIPALPGPPKTSATIALNSGFPVDYGTGGPESGTAAGRIDFTFPSGFNNYYAMPRCPGSGGGVTAAAAPTSPSTSTAPLHTSGSMSGTASDIPAGIWGGWISFDPTVDQKTKSPPGYSYSAIDLNPELNIGFAMQYQDANGNWQTYSTWKDLHISSHTSPTTTLTSFLQSSNFFVRFDPRTNRLGSSLSYGTYLHAATGDPTPGKITSGSAFYFLAAYSASAATSPGANLRPDHYQGPAISTKYPQAANFVYTGGTVDGFCGGLFADNVVSRPSLPLVSSAGASVNLYYSDPDGVVRRADGAYSDANTALATKDGFELMPLSQASPFVNSASRPVILSRTFRSVGEMGYAYRDMPFKSIDFFTQESADAALLDVFCVDDVDMSAGRVNPNTRNAKVLQAVLAGSIKAELNPGLTISASDAASVASALVARTINTANGPLVNRSELVTKFSNDLTTALSQSADLYNKTQRESVVRALADVSNTRTWNLMIDVVAQAGRYPPTAQSLNDFVVEGERRYWLHVAIDRYTGQIIDEQLEPVYE